MREANSMTERRMKMKRDEQFLALREGYRCSMEETHREFAKFGYTICDENGIGLVAVEDSLSDSWSFFGGTSYSSLRSAIEYLLGLDNCTSIVLEINSPGGEVGGLFECASYIAQAKQTKPIHAHVTGMCCSAAYAIAVACTDITATETSEIGSIGVFAQAIDTSEYEKKMGILSRIFRSKNAENKNLSAFTEEGAKDIQAKLDFFEGKFYDLISENRGKDKEECIDNFGHGSVFLSSEALERGMVDAISEYGEFMEKLASSGEEEEGEDMDIEKLTAEQKTEVFNALVNENPSLLAEAEGKAVEKERMRITDLLALRAEGNAEIIDTAISEGKVAGDIAMDLYKCEKERADKLAANNPMAHIAKQAENEQTVEVRNPMPHDLGAEADRIANTISAARNK